MQCREARSLLDAGIRPGSTSRRRAELGFHVLECAACRAYRDALAGSASSRSDDTALLDQLMAAPPVAPPRRAPAVRAARPMQRPVQRQRRGHLRLLSGIVAICLVIFTGYIVGRVAHAVITIRQSVAEMTVPTADVARVAALPTPPLPATPSPTRPLPPTTAVAAVVAEPPIEPDPTRSGPEPSATPVWPRSAATLPTPTSTPIPLGSFEPGATPALAPLPTLVSRVVAPPPGSAITILLLGVDRRPGEDFPARTDTIIIARVEPERQRIALLSLPRDLIVPIPGVGQGRINSASVYGEMYPQLGGSLGAMRATVANLLGIPIDHAIEIDFDGFTRAIDAIGGVTIDVPYELYDNAYPTMDYRYMVVHFLAGPQEMDGARALQYARIRHPDSDFARMQRQQQVILAAGRRLREQNILDQISGIASISAALRGYVQLDIPEEKLIGLAWAFRSMSLDTVERYALDASMVQMNVLAEDPYAQFALPGTIERLTQQLMGR
ncbi:MAG TPA: LCP family protein [Roseiflexaceae bacterium]|mgnify:CR=1 FL=1|nr:LCP family protein [Roseiflexaceae bacterium]HMP39678.1 LCP family protein [Roseiflexaceae bacterium]